MTDLERRALLGDKQAQEECTQKNILLPCPCCKGKADLWRNGEKSYIECLGCGLRIENYNDLSVISDWNTRVAPPIGQCIDCDNWCRGTTFETKCACQRLSNSGDNGLVFTSPDEFCKRFKQKEMNEIDPVMNLVDRTLKDKKFHEQLLLTQQKLQEAIDSINRICKTYERVFHD